MTVSTVHDEVARAVVAKHGANRSGFKRGMARIFDDEYPLASFEGRAKTKRDFLRRFWFRPDAWVVVPEDAIIICWEVHVSSRPKDKDNRYANAFFALDEIGYTLALVDVDRRGVETPADIFGSYMDRELRP